jgi:hypothetical protein
MKLVNHQKCNAQPIPSNQKPTYAVDETPTVTDRSQHTISYSFRSSTAAKMCHNQGMFQPLVSKVLNARCSPQHSAVKLHSQAACRYKQGCGQALPPAAC